MIIDHLSGLSSFGVVSAYVDGADCGRDSLRLDIHKLGLVTTEVNGKWEGMPERNFIIFGIKFHDLMELGKKYKQSAVIFCLKRSEPELINL